MILDDLSRSDAYYRYLIFSIDLLWGGHEIDTTYGQWYKKIRNMQIVDTYALTVQCEFQRVRITGVPLARCQTSKNATWGQVN